MIVQTDAQQDLTPSVSIEVTSKFFQFAKMLLHIPIVIATYAKPIAKSNGQFEWTCLVRNGSVPERDLTPIVAKVRFVLHNSFIEVCQLCYQIVHIPADPGTRTRAFSYLC